MLCRPSKINWIKLYPNRTSILFEGVIVFVFEFLRSILKILKYSCARCYKKYYIDFKI